MVEIGWVISSKLLISKNVWDVKIERIHFYPFAKSFSIWGSQESKPPGPKPPISNKTVDCMTFESKKKAYNLVDPFPHK